MVNGFEDTDWFKSLKARDEKAFDKFFKSHSKIVFQNAYNYLKNDVEAEDVTMLTFERLWEQIEEINDVKHLQNWLFIISRNFCLNILRSTKRESKVVLSENLSVEVDPTDRYEKVYAQTMVEIHKMVEALPPRLKDAFVMRYIYGMEPSDVAVQMKIDVDSVYNLTSRALVRLRVRFHGFESLTAIFLLLLLAEH